MVDIVAPTERSSLLHPAVPTKPQHDVVDGWLSTIQTTLGLCDIAVVLGIATLTGALCGVDLFRENVYATLAPFWAACVLALVCQIRVAIGACAVRVGGNRALNEFAARRRRTWTQTICVDMSTLPLLMQIALHLVVTVPIVLLTGCSMLLLAVHHEQQLSAIASISKDAIVSEDSMQIQVPVPQVQLAQAVAPIFALLSWAFIHCIFFRSKGFLCGFSALLLLIGTVLSVLKAEAVESAARFDATLMVFDSDGESSDLEEPLQRLSWIWVTAPFLLLTTTLFFSTLWTGVEHCAGTIRLSRAQKVATFLYTVSAALLIAGHVALMFEIFQPGILSISGGCALGVQGMLIVALAELTRLRGSRGFANPLPLAQTSEGHWVASTGGYDSWFMLGQVEIVSPKLERVRMPGRFSPDTISTRARKAKSRSGEQKGFVNLFSPKKGEH